MYHLALSLALVRTRQRPGLRAPELLERGKAGPIDSVEQIVPHRVAFGPAGRVGCDVTHYASYRVLDGGG
jgi:hypothetical protein